MRLALVHNLPSGGALRSAGAQARVLSTRHTFDLYTLSTAESELEELSAVVQRRRVYPYRPSPFLKSPLGMFDPLVRMRDLQRLDHLYAQMAQDIAAERYDAVLVHPCRFTQAPLLLCHLKDPVVYFCHEANRSLYEVPPDFDPPPDFFERLRRIRHYPLDLLLKRYLKHRDRTGCRSASIVAVNSRFTAENVRRIYGVEGVVVPMGVDSLAFAPPRQRIREDFVLSVGAMAPLKGFHRAVDALARLPEGRRPRLVVVSDRSDGGYAAVLEKQARTKGVQLELHSRVSQQQLVQVYQRARLTLYTPIAEPFGLVPLESMACGTPVVGVDEGGVPETVRPGISGWLCSPEPEILAQNVNRMLADPDEVERMGAAGRQVVVESFTWEASARALEGLLEGARQRFGR